MRAGAIHRLITGILAGLLAAALVSGSALAVGSSIEVQPQGRPFQPDGWVRYYAFKGQTGKYVDPTVWKGDNIYNTTGRYQKAGQTAAGAYDAGDHYIFEIRVQNDGDTDRFKIKATGQGNWPVKYFRGTTNITGAVVAGTYQTAPLAGGAMEVIKVKVWVGGAGTSVKRLVTLTSVGNPARKDAVIVKVAYLGCTC